MDGDPEDDRLSKDEDWIEDGNEEVLIYGFEEGAIFEDLNDFLEDLNRKTEFNLLPFLREQAKDEYEIIQMINFFRTHINTNDYVRSIKNVVDRLIEKEHQDISYFKPVLENDQLLQLLPDLIEFSDNESVTNAQGHLSEDTASEDSKSETDSYYFKGYGEKNIHETMLKDKQRNDSYFYALKHSAQGKVVIDVGSGTGILSLFAILHGANFVIAIENSNIVYTALQVLFDNDIKNPQHNYKNKIIILKGKAESLSTDGLKAIYIPENPLVYELLEKVDGPDSTEDIFKLRNKKSADIIVSEWMGYGCFFEGMLDSVINVRNVCLKNEGLMIPSKASLFLEVTRFHDVDLANIHSLDFSALGNLDTVNRAIVDEIDPSEIISDRKAIIDFKLRSAEIDDLTFETEKCEMRITEFDHRIEGFVISFDCQMIPSDLGDVVLSTSTSKKSTHWAQTILRPQYLQKIPVTLQESDKIFAKLTYRRQKRNKRNLNISLEVEIIGSEQKHTFFETFLLS